MEHMTKMFINRGFVRCLNLKEIKNKEKENKENVIQAFTLIEKRYIYSYFLYV